MKYQHLKHVVSILRRTLRCSQCQKVYAAEDIDLIDIYEQEALIDAYCKACDRGVSLNIEVEEFAGPMPSRMAQMSQQTIGSEITPTEAETIAESVKLHKGSLDELFNR